MDSRVLNFTLDIVPKHTLNGPLKMILWAGDMVHNEVTDIERLPGYDIYLCFGFIHTLQANIDYLYKRKEPGYICIIDVNSERQMTDFITLFKGQFSYIDSDYHGNTPTMKPEYYNALLQTGGRAYNVEGINGLIMYRSDYINALETFAPILSAKLNDERRYTPDMLKLAKESELPVDMVWTSPDLIHPYYNNIRKGQENYSNYRKSLNPHHVDARVLGENRLEEYWSKLSESVLTFNIKYAETEANCELQELFPSYWPRFTKYLRERVEPLVDDLVDFREFIGNDIGKVQKLLKQSVIAKNFTGFTTHYGYYIDKRKKEYPVNYGMWFEKAY